MFLYFAFICKPKIKRLSADIMVSESEYSNYNILRISVRLEIGVEEDEALQEAAIKRKLGFCGRVMRSDGLEKGMMLACGEGSRRRGRPRRR